MADLKTDYKNDVLNTEINELRKYQMIQNDDGTVSFVDVTDYLQVGDSFGSADINETNAEIEEIKDNQEAKYQELEDAIDTKVTNSFTANTVPYANANGNLASSLVTDKELARLSGVTASVQNQLDAKVPNNFTASRVLASNSSGKAVASAVTVTELGYLGGVTSKIQTQLDNKQAQLDSLNIISENAVTNSVTNDCIIKVGGNSLSPANFPSCRVLLIAMHSSECAIFMFSSVSTSNFVLKEIANTGTDLTMSLSASGIVRVHRKTETGAVAVKTKVVFLAGY